MIVIASICTRLLAGSGGPDLWYLLDRHPRFSQRFSTCANMSSFYFSRALPGQNGGRLQACTPHPNTACSSHSLDAELGAQRRSRGSTSDRSLYGPTALVWSWCCSYRLLRRHRGGKRRRLISKCLPIAVYVCVRAVYANK